MYKTQGIILATDAIGEADLSLSVFTRDFGKLLFVAQGVRKRDSKLRSILQAGHMIDFVFVPMRSGRYRLTSPAIIECFSGIRNEPRKLAALLLSLAVFDKVVLEGAHDEAMWDFLNEWMSELSEIPPFEERERAAVHFWFLSGLLEVLGYGAREYGGASLRDSLVRAGEGFSKDAQSLRKAFASKLSFFLPDNCLVQ